ncbi:hypothetical protein F5876DRAFT_72455 [Lentinula aff. lateritia]|uniref:Uncharacterized protein n=1 Tax=Lentinula aff. lateritia TaxID=2804960 RepID=A0ACC1UCX6_9AGAR|nr:hypothetical protein F5876DRAFT_72455 [Lentinula aff. lateritia]
MQATLIPDQRLFFSVRAPLVFLQQAMKYTDSQFGTFKRLVRTGAKDCGLDVYKRRSYQDPEKWQRFVRWTVEREQNLNNFVEHWPVDAYFDAWTSYKHSKPHHFRAQMNKKKLESTIPQHLTINPSLTRKYVGLKPPPLRCITTNERNRSKISPSSANIKARIHYDKMVGQSCLVCPETPALASQHLDQLLQQEEISKVELVKLGVCSDLDLDTLLLLGPNELNELFLPSSMTNLEKFCFRSALPCLTPRLHLKQGITEADLRKYITKIYTCETHCILPLQTKVPSQLLKLFNKLHIEHLIPVAIMRGIETNAHFEKVSTFDDELQAIIGGKTAHISLSPLQKVTLRWAFASSI